MSQQQRFFDDDPETTGLADGDGAQTSNKAGVTSTSRKPSNSGPDPHQEHKAPVPGAFGKADDDSAVSPRDTLIGDQVPADKARKR